MSKRSTWQKAIVRLVIAGAIVLFAWAIWDIAKGQALTWKSDSVEASLTPQLSTHLWPRAQRQYQHAFRAGVEAGLRWRFVSVRGAWRFTTFKTSDAVAAGSPVNAETNRTQQETRGASLRVRWNGWFAGTRIHRVEQHHVWRHASRNGYYDNFPPSNDWQLATRRCQSGTPPPSKSAPCPGIGYWDAFGYTAGYSGYAVAVQLSYLPHRWKDVTLVPSEWTGAAEVRLGRDWRVRGRAQYDLRRQLAGRLVAERRLLGRLWMGVGAARVQPDHRAPLWHTELFFKVR